MWVFALFNGRLVALLVFFPHSLLSALLFVFRSAFLLPIQSDVLTTYRPRRQRTSPRTLPPVFSWADPLPSGWAMMCAFSCPQRDKVQVCLFKVSEKWARHHWLCSFVSACLLQLRPPPAGVSSELAWRGESSPSCPQLLMHPAWLSQDEMGAIQPN